MSTPSPAITAAVSKSPAVARLVVARGFVRLMLHQLGLAAAPLLGELIAQHAARIGRGPNIAPRDVEQDAADGLVAARRNDPLLGGVRTERLLRRKEARADQHAVGAEHQRRREAAPVRDAARRRDRNAARRIDDRRHQREGAARDAVAAGLGALRDQHIRAIATASFACSTVCTWQIISAPACLILSACGFTSPNDSMMAAGLRSSAMSSRRGFFAMLQVMKPTPTRASPAASSSRLSQASLP